MRKPNKQAALHYAEFVTRLYDENDRPILICRVRTEKGWIYHSVMSDGSGSGAVAMTFVPDPVVRQ